jgi:hypothetical protein
MVRDVVATVIVVATLATTEVDPCRKNTTSEHIKEFGDSVAPILTEENLARQPWPVPSIWRGEAASGTTSGDTGVSGL